MFVENQAIPLNIHGISLIFQTCSLKIQTLKTMQTLYLNIRTVLEKTSDKCLHCQNKVGCSKTCSNIRRFAFLYSKIMFYVVKPNIDLDIHIYVECLFVYDNI